MAKKPYATYKDYYSERIEISGPDRLLLKAYRTVREGEMDIFSVTSDFYSIVLPVIGQADFLQCGQSFLLSHDTVGIRWPNEPYHFKKNENTPFEVFVFYFTDRIGPLWNRLFAKPCIGFHLASGIEIVALTKDFFTLALHAEKDRQAELCDWFSEFFLRTLASSRCEEKSSVTDARLPHVVQYMEEQFQNIRSVGAVSKHFGMSRGTLYNIFKGSSYGSPGRFLARLKMDAAVYLLRQTGWSLQNIADELGYETIDSFSKAFKSVQGVSPSGYRKESG